jgi:uncharacterized protein
MEKRNGVVTLNLRHLSEEETAVSLAVMPQPDWHLTTDGQVQVDLRAIRQRSKEVYVFGTATAALLLECSRCLVSFPYPVTAQIGAYFLPEGEKAGERTEPPEDAECYFYSGEGIGLDEVITGGLHLETPISPICHEACAGLCPRCTKNLNDGRCACPVTVQDIT